MTLAKTLFKPGLQIHLPPTLSVAIALLTIYLIWGSTYLATAIALESYPPFMLIAIRLLVSIAILLPGLKRRQSAQLSPRQILNAAVTGT